MIHNTAYVYPIARKCLAPPRPGRLVPDWALGRGRGATLYMLTREAAFPPTSDSDQHTVLAFGVNNDGIALVSSVTLNLNDDEDAQ